MGKGQRIRAERAVENEAKKEQLAKQKKKSKITKITVSVIAILLILGIVGGFVYNSVRAAALKRGDLQRETVILKTDNFTVDGTMMSYFFYTEYNSFANSYSSYLSSLGLSTAKPLREQASSFTSDGGTWFDYFCDTAVTTVKEYLYLAEKAVADGIALDDDDKATIQKTIDNYYTYAKEYKMSNAEFLRESFGTGVNEGDVRRCLELSTLASKYFKKYQSSLNYTDEVIETYYRNNMESYRYVDFYSYTITAADTKDDTTYAVAKNKAEELAKKKDTKAFAAWVEADFRAANPITDDFTEEELKKELETELQTLELKQQVYDEESDASKWLFEKAKVGETFIEDDESGSYTVYLCTATPYRDESATRVIRDIIFTDATYGENGETEKKAKEILAKMASEGLTDATFEKYAAEYSENTATSANGGLCENYKQSSFEGNIGNWAFDSARKAGDFEAIKIDGGYAILYYVGEGIPAWKSDCITAKKSDDYTAAMEGWKKDITLTENSGNYKVIPDINE